MKNVNIMQVRPATYNNSDAQGAYIAYNVVLKPTDHTINGSFTASADEVKQAVNNNTTDNWDGFKALAIHRITEDVKNLESSK